MTAATEIIVLYVAPALGMLLANLMFFSPLFAVLAVRKAGALGDLNPLPFPVILANCCCWIGYSMLTVDWFLYFSNLPGALLGLFFVLSTIVYSPPKTRKSVELLTVVLMMEALVVAGALALLQASMETTKFTWGLNCNLVLMLYYGAPLSAIATVLRQRSSSTIYWPTCLANFLNGSLWFSYGLWGTKDFWLWIPNGLGALLAALQLFLCIVFPRVPAALPEANSPGLRTSLPTVSSVDSLTPLAVQPGLPSGHSV